MDLETENRIAAILLKEADELRRQAQKEGALAYLREPTVRSRPNSRFLTATVRGVQQANRAVEVNEMWRIRDKQLELEKKLRGLRDGTSKGRSHSDGHDSHSNRIRRCSEVETIASTSHSSKKRAVEDLVSMDTDGLRDEDIEEFLNSRTKRGRGAVGSRMDETGPYPPLCPDSDNNVSENVDQKPRKARVMLGPEKPYSLDRSDSSDEESVEDERKKIKKGSSKRRSKKHKSKEKSRDKKKKRKEKKIKHYK